MHFRRKHADSDFSDELRFAEKLASIDVARKPAGRNSSKIIDPSRVRTEIKTWRPCPARVWKATSGVVGRKAQLDSPEGLRRLSHRRRLPRLRQLMQPEHDQSPRLR
jgi:hypothetical protein